MHMHTNSWSTSRQADSLRDCCITWQSFSLTIRNFQIMWLNSYKKSTQTALLSLRAQRCDSSFHTWKLKLDYHNFPLRIKHCLSLLCAKVNYLIQCWFNKPTCITMLKQNRKNMSWLKPHYCNNWLWLSVTEVVNKPAARNRELRCRK